jgi:hypothetical protein
VVDCTIRSAPKAHALHQLCNRTPRARRFRSGRAVAIASFVAAKGAAEKESVMFKQIIIGGIGLAIAAVGVSSAPVAAATRAPDAQHAAPGGSCGCLPGYSACIAKEVRPGSVVSGMQKCDESFNACADSCKDKKACKDECRDAKDVAKNACEKIFDETSCKLGDDACKKDARKDRADCVKEGRKDKRSCLKGCGG